MKKEKCDYIKEIKSSLTKINRENLKTFDFSKKDIFTKVEDKLLFHLDYDLFDTFYAYIDLLIENILEIRKDDAINVFAKGFERGIEFERFLRDKHEKSEQ